MNRKGFEISINLIVTIIISIVVLGFGISIFTQLFEKTVDFDETVSQNNQAKLNRLLDTGEPVVVMGNTKTVTHGSTADFAYAVLNTEDSAMHFDVKIETSGTPWTSGIDPNANEVIYNPDPFELGPKERKHSLFRVAVPGGTAKGTYILTLEACYNETDPAVECGDPGSAPYFHPINIYVNVPQ